MIPIQIHPRTECLTFRTDAITAEKLKSDVVAFNVSLSDLLHTKVKEELNALFLAVEI